MEKVRKYELVYVLGEKVTDEEAENVKAKIEDVISRFEGSVEKFEDWGKRKLAYEIKKNQFGHYFMVIFTALPESQRELTRVLRLDERVIRFMSLIVKEPRRKSTTKSASPESGEKEEKEVNAQLQ